MGYKERAPSQAGKPRALNTINMFIISKKGGIARWNNTGHAPDAGRTWILASSATARSRKRTMMAAYKACDYAGEKEWLSGRVNGIGEAMPARS